MVMKPDKGFLLIDKPAGITSFDVIRRLRKLSGIRRIGHCGTLDPFATGLLICALGSYTRLNSFLEARDKSYEATVLLGKTTLTGDTEGEIHEILPVDIGKLDPSRLKAAALALTELPIPAFSAVKVDGKRAYDLARAGQVVELAARPTQITDFELLRLPLESDPDPLLSYMCTVSKGTYIRSLSQWIAEQLGTVGHTIALRRTAIGDIAVQNAVPLESLDSDNWPRQLCPPPGLFSHLEAWQASQTELDALNNGQSFPAPGEDTPGLMVFDPSGDLVGVAIRTEGRIYPKVNLR